MAQPSGTARVRSGRGGLPEREKAFEKGLFRIEPVDPEGNTACGIAQKIPGLPEPAASLSTASRRRFTHLREGCRSGRSKSAYAVRTSFSPALAACAYPVCARRTRTVAEGQQLRTICAVPSFEPSSTTMISGGQIPPRQEPAGTFSHPLCSFLQEGPLSQSFYTLRSFVPFATKSFADHALFP